MPMKDPADNIVFWREDEIFRVLVALSESVEILPWPLRFLAKGYTTAIQCVAQALCADYVDTVLKEQTFRELLESDDDGH